jgi:arsenate reductase (thioredoxin)
MAPRILYVCTHRGARSRMAEELTRQLAAGGVDAFSSSFESGTIGPLPIGVLREVGIEMPTDAPKSVFDRHRDREAFDYVVTICQEGAEEQCAVFNQSLTALYGRRAEMISWSVPDFQSLAGSQEEKLEAARQVRDQIRTNVRTLLSHLGITVDGAAEEHGPATAPET